jgi:serine protease AprX
MKKHFLLWLLISVVMNESQAQLTRYLVRLKDKGSSPYAFNNPLAYLSQRAIDRRTRYGIAIDSTDLPVTPSYLTQISNVPNVILLNASRWLNAVSILTADAGAITTLNAFPFVQSVDGLAARPAQNDRPLKNKIEMSNNVPAIPSGRPTGINSDFFDYGSNSFNEIHLHNGEFLHNIGLRGQGMQIAMLDDGFFNYAAFHAFDSVNSNNQVLGTWDFVAQEQNVLNDGNHGMSCFSTIAANMPGQFIGNAPKASFWLFRTEDDASEYPIEEHNWACGAERADSSGADIISTSLGYTTFDSPLTSNSHVYADMNGRTTMAAIAADLAAKKGILIFAANGNDGGDSWHYLSTPADGDSVVAVGAVSTTGAVAAFSSYGPSSDGRVKPDIASVGSGALIENSAGFVSNGNGTSFSCPKMAGMGTCLWQGFPEFNNIKIIRAMQKAGSIFANPNDRIGYGIPNMKKAFSNLLVDFATSNAVINDCAVTLTWTSKDIDAMKYEIERKAVGDASYSKIGDMAPLPGTLLANHSYQFVNNLENIADGAVSYRIRQIIDTAVAGFADAYIDTANIVSSGCTAPGNGNPGTIDYILLSPNPVAGGIPSTLVIQTENAVTDMSISIYDMKGSLVMRLLSSKGPGRTTIDLPVNKLSKGKYIIKVNDGQKKIGTTTLLRL